MKSSQTIGGSDIKSTLLGKENSNKQAEAHLEQRNLKWAVPALSANSAQIKIAMKSPDINDITSDGITVTCLLWGLILILWTITIIMLVMSKFSSSALALLGFLLFFTMCGCGVSVWWRYYAKSRKIKQFQKEIKKYFRSDDCNYYENMRQISFMFVYGMIDYDKNKLYIYEFGLNGKLGNSYQRSEPANQIKHQLLCVDISSLRSICGRCDETTLKISRGWYDNYKAVSKRQDYRIELTYLSNNLTNENKTMILNRYSVIKSESEKFVKWFENSLKPYNLNGLIINNDNINDNDDGSTNNDNNLRVNIINSNSKSGDECMDKIYDIKLKELQEMNDNLFLSSDLDTVNNAGELDYFLKKYPKEMAKEFTNIEKHWKDDTKNIKSDPIFLAKVLIRKGQNWEKLADQLQIQECDE